MDLTQTIIAKSDQLNADDLMGGPQTFTVVDVLQGDSEQPVKIVLAELPKGRTFKPSKTVRRIFVHAWGKETNDWPKGARMTLYRAAEVKWAGQEVGGIRVSHLSHISEPLELALQESKSKKVLYTVYPLADEPDAAPEPTPAELAAQVAHGIKSATTEDEIREWGNRAHARGLLDVEVEGKALRELVTFALAAFGDQDAATEAGDQ